MLWSRTTALLETAEILSRRRNESPEEEIIDAEIAAAEEQVQRHRRAAEWQDRLEKFRRENRRTVRGTGKSLSSEKRNRREAEERGGGSGKFKECGCPARFGTKCGAAAGGKDQRDEPFF